MTKRQLQIVQINFIHVASLLKPVNFRPCLTSKTSVASSSDFGFEAFIDFWDKRVLKKL